MITFLRKIRLNLMKSGQSSKYLKYAMGEIALVVIGILLALQINDWNEERKNDNQERQILAELLQDIGKDKADINAQLERYERIVSQIDYYLGNASDENRLNSQFGNLFDGISFNLNTTTFETLKGRGLHSLKNSELRGTISTYYAKCQWFMGMVDQQHRNFRVIYQEPFKNRHIRIVYDEEDRHAYVPKDWGHLSQSGELEDFLGYKKYSLKFEYYFYSQMLKRADEAIASIQQYLDTE
jgi:hypothetical protein